MDERKWYYGGRNNPESFGREKLNIVSYRLFLMKPIDMGQSTLICANPVLFGYWLSGKNPSSTSFWCSSSLLVLSASVCRLYKVSKNFWKHFQTWRWGYWIKGEFGNVGVYRGTVWVMVIHGDSFTRCDVHPQWDTDWRVLCEHRSHIRKMSAVLLTRSDQTAFLVWFSCLISSPGWLAKLMSHHNSKCIWRPFCYWSSCWWTLRLACASHGDIACGETFFNEACFSETWLEWEEEFVLWI